MRRYENAFLLCESECKGWNNEYSKKIIIISYRKFTAKRSNRGRTLFLLHHINEYKIIIQWVFLWRNSCLHIQNVNYKTLCVNVLDARCNVIHIGFISCALTVNHNICHHDYHVFGSRLRYLLLLSTVDETSTKADTMNRFELWQH